MFVQYDVLPACQRMYFHFSVSNRVNRTNYILFGL